MSLFTNVLCEASTTQRARRPRSPDCIPTAAFHKKAKLESVTAIAPIAVANAAVHATFR